MPEITDLKAGAVPTEEELLGLVDKASRECPLTGGKSAPERCRVCFATADQNCGRWVSAMTKIEAALPSLIAAKAQAEMRVRELEAQVHWWKSQLQNEGHAYEDSLDREDGWIARADQAEGRVRELEGVIEDGTAWKDAFDLKLQAVGVENARLRALLRDAVESLEVTFQGNFHGWECSADDILSDARSALQQKGGAL